MESPSKGRVLLAVFLLLLVTFGVYANSMDGQFLWDDETLIRSNPFVRQVSFSAEIFTTTLFDGAGNFSNFYRPLQTLSLVCDRAIWNFNVFGYHLTNVLFHALTAVALLWLSWLLFKNFLVAFLAALFFAVHPIHTEAVSYVAGRADPMAALFVLLSLSFYLRRQLWPTLFCFIAALLCRENALMLLPIVAFYHFAWKKRLWNNGAIGVLIVSAIYLIVRAKILSGLLITTIAANQPSTWERLPCFFMAFPQYLKLLIFPLGLHMEYGSILFPWSDPGVITGIFVFLVYLAVLVWARKHHDFLFWCLGFFLLGLLPVSHLFLINAYMAEHWLYLPSLGFFWLLANFFKDRKTLLSLAVAVAVYFSALTIYQNQFWRDPVLFYKTLMRYAPNSPKVYNNLAKVYHEQGKKDELIDLLKKALSVDSRNFAALNNLGNALKDAGRYKEAEESYRKAIELEPTGAHQYMNLSLLYSDVYKDKAKAIELLEKAISSNPRCAEAYHQLAFLASKDREWDKAIGYLKKEIEIYPDLASAYKLLGYVYYNTQQWSLAESAFQKAIQLKPDFAEAYHDLAVVYASQGKNQEAQSFVKRSEDLGFKDPEFYKSLTEKK